MNISDELWEEIKEKMCDGFCHWPVAGLDEDELDRMCSRCPLNEVDNPLGYCPEQE